jgi:hypothetical protein
VNFYAVAKYVLSIAFISDSCKFSKEGITFSINGYRFKEKQLLYKDINNINNNFFSIYSWLYFGGNIYDKSQIVKNIISIHCKYCDITQIDSNVFDTIKSNYNLYLKDNVKDYLVMKKDVANSIQVFCNNISDEINKFSGALKANLIAILGYIATILFSKGVTGDTTNIFTYDISILTSFVLLGSFFVCIISVVHTCLKKKYYESNINGLKKYYMDIMEEKEMNQMINTNENLSIARINYRTITIVVTILWAVIIVGLFLVLDYVSGNCKLLLIINLFKQ